MEKHSPTPRELQILKLLWEYGPSSVKDVHRRLVASSEADRDLAYNTVQTLLRIMDEKGLVAHAVQGRTFIYSASHSRDETTAGFLDRVFDGAVSELVLSLLRSERLSAAELEQVHILIAAARRRNRAAQRQEEGP